MRFLHTDYYKAFLLLCQQKKKCAKRYGAKAKEMGGLDMIKKIAILILVCLLVLCSCSAERYTNTEAVELNYNNITNSNRFWLTTDTVLYMQDYLVQPYFMADKSSRKIIGYNNGYGSAGIQRYDDKIYMMHITADADGSNYEYELECYDIKTKKTQKLCNVMNCHSFLVLGESIYYLEELRVDGSRQVLALKRFSTASNEHTTISGNVASFGVIDDSLHYTTEENGMIDIFIYDAKKAESVKRSDCFIEGFVSDSLFTITSYTAQHIFFVWQKHEGEKTVSMLSKYSFNKNTVKSIELEGSINNFVSYDANSYFILEDEEKEKNELYMLDNATGNTTKIDEFKGYMAQGELFVGSDKGVYVLRPDYNLVYYSNDGKAQVVYRF